MSYPQPGISQVAGRPLATRMIDLVRAVRASWDASDAPISISTHSDRWLGTADIAPVRVATVDVVASSVTSTTTSPETSASAPVSLPTPRRQPIELDPRWLALDGAFGDSVEGATTPQPPVCPARELGARHTLRARLLGRFEVELDGIEITQWHGQLAPAILRFLLAQPKRSCARDVLLEHFWPGADPYRSRNRLHVALTALRQALRVASAVNVVQFQDGIYRLAPELDVALDIDGFERCIAESRRADNEGRGDAAVALLQRAVELYRGDFLADAPYEAWTTVARESLRTTYLDALDRLAAAHIASGRLGEACDIAQRILQQDPCREDARRMLMRAAASQGRPQEVARQYELCRRALADHLGVHPAPATTALYREARAQAADRRDLDWGYVSSAH